MSSKSVLVPIDFTEVAECALGHAIQTAKKIDADIHLLHVVDEKDNIEDVKEKLSQVAAGANANNPDITFHQIVRVGNIFDDIGDAASEVGAGLIIMGTHGKKGLQYLVGSNALRVITNSSIPFIVVQLKKVKDHGYQNIVVPLDLHKETKQKLKLVADMARYFGSKVHLITPNETDEFLKNKLTRNIAFAKQYLKERDIDHDAKISEEDGSGFVRAIQKYAVQLDADLITIMNLQKNSLMGILGSSYEQDMITNDAMIPVMCINPIVTTVVDMPIMFQ